MRPWASIIQASTYKPMPRIYFWGGCEKLRSNWLKGNVVFEYYSMAKSCCKMLGDQRHSADFKTAQATKPFCCCPPCYRWHKREDQSFVVLTLSEGNPPVTGGFPSQRVSDAERGQGLVFFNDRWGVGVLHSTCQGHDPPPLFIIHVADGTGKKNNTSLVHCIPGHRWLCNTLRPQQHERCFADDILKCTFLTENICIFN